MNSSSFIFYFSPKIVLAIPVSLSFYMNFGISCSVSIKEDPAGILTEVVLNLYTDQLRKN